MLYKKFVKHLYFPLICLIKGEKILPYLKKLERSQYLSFGELKEKQWVSLKKLLNCANEHVPYYQRLFKEKQLSPEMIKTYEDFLRIPLLSKDIVRQQQRELINTDYTNKFYTTRTSGSTGLALEVCHGIEFDSWLKTGQWRARRWFGIDVGSKGVYIWGRPLESQQAERIAKIKASLRNVMLISAFELSGHTLLENWRKIEKFKPEYIYGYASSIYKLAEYLHKENIKVSFILQGIFSTAETLFAYQRSLIEVVFKCQVRQEYGCAEMGAFAYECPKGRMHIFFENVLVEFLNGNQPVAPGKMGDVVVTSLNNFYMPLIRYKLQDKAVPLDGTCACGRALPLMDVKVAKVTDMIITSKGDVFTSELFDYINLELVKKGIRGIRQFRVIQERRNKFAVEVVKDISFQEESVQYFQQKMKEFFGEDISIAISYMSEIEREENGKIRYFVSRVS